MNENTVNERQKPSKRGFLKRLVMCHWLDQHDWDRKDFKRICKRCPAEEWVMQRPYPKIGEPQTFWKRMWPL